MADLGEAPLILGKNKIAEGREAGRASKPPTLSLLAQSLDLQALHNYSTVVCRGMVSITFSAGEQLVLKGGHNVLNWTSS